MSNKQGQLLSGLLVLMGIVGIVLCLVFTVDVDGDVRTVRVGIPDAWLVAEDSPNGFNRNMNFLRFSFAVGVLGICCVSTGVRNLMQRERKRDAA